MIVKETSSIRYYMYLDTLASLHQLTKEDKHIQYCKVYKYSADSLCILEKKGKSIYLLFSVTNNIDFKSHTTLFLDLKDGKYLYDYPRKNIIFYYDNKEKNNNLDDLYNFVPKFTGAEVYFFTETNAVYKIFNTDLKLLLFVSGLFKGRLTFDKDEINNDAFKTIIGQVFSRLGLPYKLFESHINFLVENKELILRGGIKAILKKVKNSQIKLLKNIMLPAFTNLEREEKAKIVKSIITLEEIRKTGIPLEYCEISIPEDVNWKGKTKNFMYAFTFSGKIYIIAKNNTSIRKFKKGCKLNDISDDLFLAQRLPSN